MAAGRGIACDEHGFLTDFVDGSDMMIWITQGDIVDRTREHLVDTDRGIVLYRRMLTEQAARVADGLDPIGVSRGRESVIELPQERNKYGDGARFLAESLDASHARFSPLHDQIVELLRIPTE